MSEHVKEREKGTDHPAPLRRNWRFQTLWIGAGAANLGLEAVEVAYPLLILALTDSPALAGLFGFIQVGTIILVGLPAGVLVDRWDRRRVLLVAEATRALALSSVIVALALDQITVAHLMAAAVVLGTGTAFGATARMLLIRAVVPPQQLTLALSQDEARGGVAALAGPPLGGALFVAARAYPFVAAAIGFVISFGCALVVRAPKLERPSPASAPTSTTSAWGPLATVSSGLREVLGSKLLRVALLLICVFYLSLTAAILVVVVSLREQGTSAAMIGVALSGSAVGMLVGAALVPRLNTHLSPGVLLLCASALATGAAGLLALRLGPWWVFAMLLVAALGLPALKILVDILIFRQTPDERRGQAVSATITLIGAGSSLGSLVGGLALQYLEVTRAVLLIAGIQGLVTLAGFANQNVRGARWPEEA
ncbi:MFS transporter [Salinispora sp. H7-4]|uniref:MFS transporter n=1 Tax=Salinispora sp. H7-4 TaxID=2748321 RepID=UPI0015D41894|nr:MFS transporter [Salinispora sp. H7-4]NYT94014.1 MFS transporter [Salinispora sp. H7-4]